MNVPDSLSIVDFLIIIVTLFLGYQIYRVLGMRTGHEKKRSTSFPEEEVPLASEQEMEKKQPKVLKKIKDAKVVLGVEKIMQADPSFNPDEFLDGAKKAFEMIFNAFVEGNKKKLKPLLSTTLYNEFSYLIDERDKAKQTTELEFFRLVGVDIIGASLVRKVASLTVSIRSEQTLLVKKGKELVDGDSNHIDDVTDVWVFERKISSESPAWILKEIVEKEDDQS